MARKPAKYSRVLDANRVVRTLEQLRDRIEERFPGAGLAGLCGDLVETARTTQAKARALGRPYVFLRLLVAVVVVVAVAVQVFALELVDWRTLEKRTDTVSLTQGLELAVNLALLAAGAIYFLATLETRLKRARTLTQLYELRSFAHVIDMYQLTKDPTTILGGQASRTASSPQRAMNEFQLARYLDYCSEMLALVSKLAVLYAAHSRDGEIVDAIHDIEVLTSDLGRKIWQKITILSQLRDGEATPPVQG